MKISSSVLQSAYNSNLSQTKEAKSVKDVQSNVVVSKQGDKSRVEHIKDAIANGEYKIDLDALSKKIADELLL